MLAFSHNSFQIVRVKDLRISVLRQSLFQGEAGISEPNLIYIKSAPIRLQDDDVLRNGVDKPPKLRFIFPGPLFSSFAVLDVGPRAVPPKDASLYIPQR